jgi:hypothetical protein
MGSWFFNLIAQRQVKTIRPTAVLLAVFLLAAGPGPVTAGEPIVHSTFLGPGTGRCLAVGIDGSIVVAGHTTSREFPVVNAWQPALAGMEGGDAYLVKLAPSGQPVFATHFGGSGQDSPLAIGVDPDGNIYIAGFTTSTDLPVTSDALQADYGGGTAFGFGDVFIAKFSADGSQLLYCSYLGGRGDEICGSLAFDPHGNLLLAGVTASGDFPGTKRVGSRKKNNAFVAKLSADGQQLLWSTVIGGSGHEAGLKVRVADDGVIYFTGSSMSPDLPVTVDAVHSLHPFCAGDWAEFCTEFLTSDDFTLWAGFFGILEAEGDLRYLSYAGQELFAAPDLSRLFINDLAILSDGALVVVGEANTTAAAHPAWQVFQPDPGGGTDGFVARLDPPDWRMSWFTYLGGMEDDVASDLTVDADGRLYVVGSTRSFDFPLRDALNKRADGSWDGFLSSISPDGRVLNYSTLIGGRERDSALRVALSPSGMPIISGVTISPDFPLQQAFRNTITDGAAHLEAFVMKLVPSPVRPRLDVTRSDRNLLISWPVDAEGFMLEISGDFRDGEWKAVPDAPLVLGSRKAVITRPAEAAQFYRLRRP